MATLLNNLASRSWNKWIQNLSRKQGKWPVWLAMRSSIRAKMGSLRAPAMLNQVTRYSLWHVSDIIWSTNIFRNSKVPKIWYPICSVKDLPGHLHIISPKARSPFWNLKRRVCQTANDHKIRCWPARPASVLGGVGVGEPKKFGKSPDYPWISFKSTAPLILPAWYIAFPWKFHIFHVTLSPSNNLVNELQDVPGFSRSCYFLRETKRCKGSSKFVWRGHATSSAERKLSFL